MIIKCFFLFKITWVTSNAARTYVRAFFLLNKNLKTLKNHKFVCSLFVTLQKALSKVSIQCIPMGDHTALWACDRI